MYIGEVILIDAVVGVGKSEFLEIYDTARYTYWGRESLATNYRMSRNISMGKYPVTTVTIRRRLLTINQAKFSVGVVTSR